MWGQEHFTFHVNYSSYEHMHPKAYTYSGEKKYTNTCNFSRISLKCDRIKLWFLSSLRRMPEGRPIA